MTDSHEERIQILEANCSQNSEDHADIIVGLMKLKYGIYGAIIFLIVHEVGIIKVLEKIVRF